MGCSAIRANSAAPISCSATQSGLRTLTSGSRDPKARAAAVKIEVREGNPLASIQELSTIFGWCGRWLLRQSLLSLTNVLGKGRREPSPSGEGPGRENDEPGEGPSPHGGRDLSNHPVK